MVSFFHVSDSGVYLLADFVWYLSILGGTVFLSTLAALMVWSAYGRLLRWFGDE